MTRTVHTVCAEIFALRNFREGRSYEKFAILFSRMAIFPNWRFFLFSRSLSINAWLTLAEVALIRVFCKIFEMSSTIFSIESCVRGYHVYKSSWAASIGEILLCEREERNLEDPYAVAIVRNGVIVGHVPRTISCVYVRYICVEEEESRVR